MVLPRITIIFMITCVVLLQVFRKRLLLKVVIVVREKKWQAIHLAAQHCAGKKVEGKKKNTKPAHDSKSKHVLLPIKARMNDIGQ